MMKKNLLLILLLLPLTVFAQNSFTITALEKGFVLLKSGERKEGKIGYKISMPDEDTVLIRFKVGKEKFKYTPDQLEDYGKIVLLSDLKNDHKNPNKNFHPGQLFMSDGTTIEGKIACKFRPAAEADGTKTYGPMAVRYANENGTVTDYEAKRKRVIYYIQKVDGQEAHYINAYDNFVRVGNPKGRFSYFRNPRPTHVNESATALTKSVAEAIEREATEAAAKAAAKKSFEADKDKDILTATGNATVAAMNAAQLVQDAIAIEDMGAIYYPEYFIVDNKKQTRSIVYKKNIDDVLNALLDGCGLGDKIIKKTGNIKELTEVMTFLEENVCD